MPTYEIRMFSLTELSPEKILSITAKNLKAVKDCIRHNYKLEGIRIMIIENNILRAFKRGYGKNFRTINQRRINVYCL